MGYRIPGSRLVRRISVKGLYRSVPDGEVISSGRNGKWGGGVELFWWMRKGVERGGEEGKNRERGGSEGGGGKGGKGGKVERGGEGRRGGREGRERREGKEGMEEK